VFSQIHLSGIYPKRLRDLPHRPFLDDKQVEQLVMLGFDLLLDVRDRGTGDRNFLFHDGARIDVLGQRQKQKRLRNPRRIEGIALGFKKPIL
jgi:hypothetical protein